MKTLIVEDSSTLCAIYEAYLDDTGYEVHAVETFTGALMALESLKPDLILLDIELPDGNGLDLLAETVLMDPQPAVVVMTGHGIEFADQAIERGADDFLGKPFDASRLRVTLANAAQRLELTQKLSKLGELRERLGPIMGASSVMQAVYTTIESLASSRATALITGESGTGKELAAKAIHDLSARAPSDFIAINCAAIPNDLIESELFGEAPGVRGNLHARDGLIKQSDGGTLFLDEVCDMPYELQSVLLRFIQSGSFKPVGSDNEFVADVRILAATNRDPLFEMREGRLREDLFYRLHVVPLRIPPLRERGDDVLLLSGHYLKVFAEQEGRQGFAFSEDARRELRRYPWPGNVRQLENIIHRLVLMSSDQTIDYEQLRVAIMDSDTLDAAPSVTRVAAAPAADTRHGGGVEPLWLTEKRAIQTAIDYCDGNVNRAAGLLEVAPSTIYRKIQSWKS
ncbi:sigma-54-dependent transcriptional regulator [Luminiphilus sp. nBUS_16]|uniref:sigma-54-dependent transcriptional regulator n=1 Tax=Luminiphilus sp. nBUS_16 TaxID=3395315 RepID=UPI003EBAE033